MMRRPSFVLAAAVLALAQIGFLSWIIVARASVLRNGHEVLLKVEPVDPRDLLRGDYVWLGYEISRISASLIVDAPPEKTIGEAAPIYVRLQKQDDGYWRAVSASFKQRGDAGPDAVDIRGWAYAGQPLDAGAAVSLVYGIERFYLPEGAGKPIEQDISVRSFGIVAAVPASGKAQTKALMDGEKLLFEEPLY